jgi:hypothetical protein
MKDAFLLFHIDLRTATHLLDGRLLLMDGHNVRSRFIATSGAPQWQQRGDFTAKGRGPIPRPDICGLECYQVDTRPHWVPDVAGIEGEFYEIHPTEVTIPGGEKRSHFGIHRDANAPGSAGCIVLPTKSGWDSFKSQMKRLEGMGIKQIPLQVDYAN